MGGNDLWWAWIVGRPTVRQMSNRILSFNRTGERKKKRRDYWKKRTKIVNSNIWLDGVGTIRLEIIRPFHAKDSIVSSDRQNRYCCNEMSSGATKDLLQPNSSSIFFPMMMSTIIIFLMLLLLMPNTTSRRRRRRRGKYEKKKGGYKEADKIPACLFHRVRSKQHEVVYPRAPGTLKVRIFNTHTPLPRFSFERKI